MENSPSNAMMLERIWIYYFYLKIDIKQSPLSRKSQEIYLFGNKFNVLLGWKYGMSSVNF